MIAQERKYVNLLQRGSFQILSQSKPAVKKLSDPRFFIVGHLTWEKNGLWQSFEEVGSVIFFHIYQPDNKWNVHLRKKFNQDLLGMFCSHQVVEKFDVAFFYCDSSYIEKETIDEIKSSGVSTVLMGLDDKHKFAKRKEFGFDVGQELLVPYFDFYWTTWKYGMPLINSLGGRGLYLAEGANPNFHRRLETRKDIDVLFIGGAYGIRGEIVKYLLSKNVNVATFGQGWPNGFVDFEQSIQLINRSKIVLGIGGTGHGLNIKHLKGRDFEVPMCGAFYLTLYNYELADWYHIGKEIACYSNKLELLEMINYYLVHDDERNKIANSGFKRASETHKWKDRINDLLLKLQGE